MRPSAGLCGANEHMKRGCHAKSMTGIQSASFNLTEDLSLFLCVFDWLEVSFLAAVDERFGDGLQFLPSGADLL